MNRQFIANEIEISNKLRKLCSTLENAIVFRNKQIKTNRRFDFA